MEQVFINVLNNAITASVLIVAVITVRAFGKKMPKWITCMLWMIVAVKLVFPIHIESVLSLIPTREPIPMNITVDENPQIASGISGVDETVNSVIQKSVTPAQVESVNPLQVLFRISGFVWLTGMAVMLVYAVVTYLLIRKRVSASVKVAPKVYECDDISDSFILGIISPRVYLPSGLSEDAREYILKHEFAHMSRFDHIWKPLGFTILSAYWFNPLCWVAYILLCRDIEYACDEKVTKNIEKSEKAEYCRVLLENSMPRKMIAACPVAFGETDVKNRIKNVVKYKKPAFLITLASILVCIAVGVCFATSREQTAELEQVQEENKDGESLAEETVNASLASAPDQKPALKENKDPKIAGLIQKYYEACMSNNIESLRSICRGYSENDENQIKESAESIEKNDLNKIYTLPGAGEGSYLAYVYNTTKFKYYEKAVPQLECLYICTDENGELYINGGPLNDEELKYIKILNVQPDVLALKNRIGSEYDVIMGENIKSIIADICLTRYGRVKTPGGPLYARSGPSVDDEIVAVLMPGDEYEIIDEVDGWYKIKLEEGECYVMANYVEVHL